MPEVCNPLYGHAPIGHRAIEVVRYHSRPNVTLHLLAGLGGVSHCKVKQGASDLATFMDFITECVHSVTEYGVTALKPHDILVIDNAPIHHSQTAQVLRSWLEMQGIDVIYTPKYSPDMNPVEECFSKIKSVIRQPTYGDIVQANLSHAFTLQQNLCQVAICIRFSGTRVTFNASKTARSNNDVPMVCLVHSTDLYFTTVDSKINGVPEIWRKIQMTCIFKNCLVYAKKCNSLFLSWFVNINKTSPSQCNINKGNNRGGI